MSSPVWFDFDRLLSGLRWITAKCAIPKAICQREKLVVVRSVPPPPPPRARARIRELKSFEFSLAGKDSDICTKTRHV